MRLLVSITILALGSVHADPLAKEVIRSMDFDISNHVDWNDWRKWDEQMKKFFHSTFTYDTNYAPNDQLGNSTGIHQWFEKEHLPFNMAFDNCQFNQVIFAAEEQSATTTTYGKAFWKGALATIPPSHAPVTIRIFDFYRLDGRKISYNWMMLDTVDLMLQAGFRVLPEPALPEGKFFPPRATDGIPAPISRFCSPEKARIAKDIVLNILLNDFVTGREASALWADEMTWYGPVGFGMASNKHEYIEHFLLPLHKALSHRSLELDEVVCEGEYCGAIGYIKGIHTGEWLGESATNKTVKLRFGFHYRVDTQQKIVPEGYAMFDLPRFFVQIGVNLYSRMNDLQNFAF